MKLQPLFIFSCILLCSATLPSELSAQKGNTALVSELDKVIENRQLYMEAKEHGIQLKKQLREVKFLTPKQEFEINEQLYKEYQKYLSDSAISYVLKNVRIAEEMDDSIRKSRSEIELAWLYSSRGLYFEARDLLENIDKDELDKELSARYYEVFCAFYSHYGQSNNEEEYFQKSEYYRDSLLAVLPEDSYDYKLNNGIKKLYRGRLNEAETLFNTLLKDIPKESPQQASVSYFLSLIYKQTGQVELQEKYLLISAISDVKNSIKDNASLQELALFYYKKGNVDKAYLFIDLAIKEALFCNLRYRAMETSSFYPIINASYQKKEQKRKSELQSFSIIISILSLLTVAIMVYLYKQMKKLSRIRRELKDTNQVLSRLNSDLNRLNSNLLDANHIKEEYIGHFFDLCSSYIDKLESYRKELNKLAANRKLDELYLALKSTRVIDNEIGELYKNFDSIVLNLYPSFVDDFNQLLIPEERIKLKPGELLNTELRIFALIRLGITDSVKIAAFLRYSLRTVYNYRTKMRNKSAVPRNEFENRVAEIAAFPSEES